MACLCLWALNTQAETGSPLFEADVIVSSQKPAERSQAIKQALGEVLQRVAGQQTTLDAAAVEELTQNPERFLQQFRYFTVPESDPPVLKLRARFDGEAIKQALQSQGLGYWGSERPDTLVWLAVEEQGDRYLVSAQDENAVRTAMEAAARQRGIPIIFPLMDLTDRARARLSDIWGGFFTHAISASSRYEPQAVLIGRLNRNPAGGWMVRWYLQVAGNGSSWTDRNASLDGLLAAGMADIADNLASRFAVGGAASEAHRVEISVSDIYTLTAYARVSKYLASLAPVVDVQVSQVDGPEIRYAVQLNGTLNGLSRTIAIGTVLEPVPDGLPGEYRVRQ
jgi:hypothetical protein